MAVHNSYTGEIDLGTAHDVPIELRGRDEGHRIIKENRVHFSVSCSTGRRKLLSTHAKCVGVVNFFPFYLTTWTVVRGVSLRAGGPTSQRFHLTGNPSL